MGRNCGEGLPVSNVARKRAVLLATVAGLLLLQAIHSQVDLGFDRSDWWRVLSGQLVHNNTTHFLTNALALVLLRILYWQDFDLAEFELALVVIAITTGVLVATFSAELDYYVGLSGVLHGLVVAGAGRLWFSNKGMAVSVIVLLTLKLVAERYLPGYNDGVAGLIGLPVAVQVHGFGALAGVVFVLFDQGFLRWSGRFNRGGS